jgi:copper(I)-binding protein
MKKVRSNRKGLRASRGLLAFVLLFSVAAVSCSSNEDKTVAAVDPTVSDAWARAATDLGAQDMSAIYMTLLSGGEANALLKASVPTDVAATVELHETVQTSDSVTSTSQGADSSDGTDMDSSDMDSSDMDSSDMDSSDMDSSDMDSSDMMQMKPVEKIEIPAGGQVVLEPGGYHIMLISLKKALNPGDSIDVTLTFEEGDPITTSVTVREA